MTCQVVGTLMELSDSKGRPLVVLRRAHNGQMLTILMRYRDMTEADKDAVRGAFGDVADATISGERNSTIGDIEKFLAFDEERPCG